MPGLYTLMQTRERERERERVWKNFNVYVHVCTFEFFQTPELEKRCGYAALAKMSHANHVKPTARNRLHIVVLIREDI